MHFDEDQFEKQWQDGRKLLHLFAKLNLLQKHIAKKNKTEKSKQTKLSSHVEDFVFSKYDRIREQICKSYVNYLNCFCISTYYCNVSYLNTFIGVDERIMTTNTNGNASYTDVEYDNNTEIEVKRSIESD